MVRLPRVCLSAASAPAGSSVSALAAATSPFDQAARKLVAVSLRSAAAGAPAWEEPPPRNTNTAATTIATTTTAPPASTHLRHVMAPPCQLRASVGAQKLQARAARRVRGGAPVLGLQAPLVLAFGQFEPGGQHGTRRRGRPLTRLHGLDHRLHVPAEPGPGGPRVHHDLE